MAHRNRPSSQSSKEREELIRIILNHDSVGYAEDASFRKTHRESLERLSLKQLKETVSHYDEESTTN